MCKLKIRLVLVMFLYSATSSAAEWLIEPALGLKTQYDDNIYLRAANEVDASAVIVDPSITFEGKEEIWNLRFDSRLRSIKYSGVDDADSNNLFLKFSAGRSMERSQLGISANFDRNTTFDREFDTQLPEAGLIESKIERETLTIGPYWSWRTSDKIQMSLNLNVTDVTYSENAPLNYNDNSVGTIKFSISRRQSEQVSLGVILKNTQTDIEERDYESEQNALQVFYNYSFSENASIDLLAGASTIDYVFHNYRDCVGGVWIQTFSGPFCTGSEVVRDQADDKSINEFNISYKYESELGDFNMSMYRSINTSSSGSATQSDYLTVKYNRKLTPRLKASLLFSGSKIETLDGLNASQDNEQYRFQPAINWKFSEYWNLGFNYRYIKQIITDTDVESDSNAVYVNLSMRWPRLASTY
ncbi:MAG: hypothetical protein OEY89_17325 [Gammaproteobacteria bacterium]|nr:hypothetical protein [Gammaproteobacteria bacterium]